MHSDICVHCSGLGAGLVEAARDRRTIHNPPVLQVAKPQGANNAAPTIMEDLRKRCSKLHVR